MMLGGIDEAGRGPVLGPLVVAGVTSDEEEPFADMELKDSKMCTPRAREKLAADIRNRAKRIEIVTADPEEIDAWRTTLTLNEVEVRMFTMVARGLRPDALIVDACDTDAQRFGTDIEAGLGFPCKVFSAHGADGDQAIVSAASIIAKVERDRLMADISKRCVQLYGLEAGSGYPADPITKRLLDEVVRTTGELPIGTRHSWKTAQAALRRHGHGPDMQLDQFVE
jgi:ribonuclease HII